MTSILTAGPIPLRQMTKIGTVPVATFLMLTGAMLLAIQLRLLLPFGALLTVGYRAQFPALYLLIALVAVLMHGLMTVLPAESLLGHALSDQHPVARFLVTALISFVAMLALFPDVSQLQLVYYLSMSSLLCLLMITLPRRIYVGQPGNNLGVDLVRLWNNRALVQLWVTHNIRSRYSQAVLGILWIILLPLLMALVLAIAFTQFLRVQFDVPIVCFFLSGLVPYNLFSAGISNSTSSILGKLGIVTQVYFPREVLVLITLGEGLVDFAFTFAAMIVVNLSYGIYPNVHYVYLPFLIIILVILTFGFMLIISSISVLVRDVPQLIAVGLQLLFYLTPIIYPVDKLPPQLRFVFVLNPLASIVQAFRDIVLYNRPPVFVTLYYPVVLSFVILYLGYCIFKSIEGTMADMI